MDQPVVLQGQHKSLGYQIKTFKFNWAVTGIAGSKIFGALGALPTVLVHPNFANRKDLWNPCNQPKLKKEKFVCAISSARNVG
jgi:hypothetical protein